MKIIHEFPNDVQKLIDISAIYFNDGAPQTAADRLLAAADQLQKYADWRAESIGGENEPHLNSKK